MRVWYIMFHNMLTINSTVILVLLILILDMRANSKIKVIDVKVKGLSIYRKLLFSTQKINSRNSLCNYTTETIH